MTNNVRTTNTLYLDNDQCWKLTFNLTSINLNNKECTVNKICLLFLAQ